MILHTTPSTYIISHPDSIKYTVLSNDNNGQNKTYQLNPTLFQIHKPFITNTHTNLGSIALELESIYKNEVLPYFESIKSEFQSQSGKNCDNSNDNAVQVAQKLFGDGDYAYEKFNGANPTEFGVISEFRDRVYLFPPNCRFFNCDLFIYEFGEEDNDKYDLILMDPPWNNKFIKRRKGNCMGYETHSTDEIEKGFKSSILKQEGILAIWSTNSKTEKILNDWIGKWGLVHLTTFYWLKVTTNGKLTVPFTKEGGKQPYESLILARKKPEFQTEPSNSYPIRVIVSHISAINSHKPPLTDVLEHYFDRKFTSKCELFARYLLPNYTSYGNQVLKLNNILLFQDT